MLSMKDFEPVFSTVSRIPFLADDSQSGEIMYFMIRSLEEASKVNILSKKSNPKTICFNKDVECVTLSGKFVPGVIQDLCTSVQEAELESILTESRLIINWDVDRIDIILGGEKGFVESIEMTYQSLSKFTKIKGFLDFYGIDEVKLLNFQKAFPVASYSNYQVETLLYGLIFEVLTERIDEKEVNWRKAVSDIILTGEFPFVWGNYIYLVSLLGSALGLSKRYEFIIDIFNYFNSESLEYIEETAEAASYIFIPTELQDYKHSLIPIEGVPSDLVIEKNKIRVIEIYDKEYLEVSSIKNDEKARIDLRGNLLFVDTREIEYSDLLGVAQSSKDQLIDQFNDWERGMKVEKQDERRKVVDLDISNILYSGKSIFEQKTNKSFTLSVPQKSEVKKGQKIGIYKNKIERQVLDLVSPLDIFEDFHEHVVVIDGQLVEKGQLLAEKEGFFGNKERQLKSPNYGKVLLGNVENGFIELDVLTKNVEGTAEVSGTILKVVPGKGVLYETGEFRTNLFDTVGKSVEGELVFDYEEKDLTNKILFFEEDELSLYNLRQLLQLGLKGIVFESIHYKNIGKLEDFLVKTNLDFAIGVLMGYGKFRMGKDFKKRISRFEGHVARLDVEEKAVKIYFGGENKFSIKGVSLSQTSSFRANKEVVVRSLSSWGKIGKILSIKDRDVLVEFGDGKVELVSLYNLD